MPNCPTTPSTFITSSKTLPNSSPRRRGWSLRQRNRLSFPRHRHESSGAPIGLRLLDALLGRRDEIPPDVARPIEPCAANQQQARRRGGRHHRRLARLQDDKL